MNRVVRGSSLLIVSAIVAACAAHRDEDQAVEASRQGPAPQPATEEIDRAAKAEVRERADSRDILLSGNAQSVATPSLTKTAVLAGSFANVAPPYQQPQNTERYQHLDDNPVHLVTEQPISTFSIDVDTGAYANVRRFLNAGQLPPQDAVRVEEMV